MKFIKSLILSSLLVSAIVLPRPSQAAVGMTLSSTLMVGAGLATMAGGGVSGVFSVKNFKEHRTAVGVILALAGLSMLGMGFIFLDGEQKLVFQEVGSAEAKKLGVSSEEAAIYNSELDQANVLVAEVSSELASIEKPSKEDSVKAWEGVRDAVSPETIKVMAKIFAQ